MTRPRERSSATSLVQLGKVTTNSFNIFNKFCQHERSFFVEVDDEIFDELIPSALIKGPDDSWLLVVKFSAYSFSHRISAGLKPRLTHDDQDPGRSSSTDRFPGQMIAPHKNVSQGSLRQINRKQHGAPRKHSTSRQGLWRWKGVDRWTRAMLSSLNKSLHALARNKPSTFIDELRRM